MATTQGDSEKTAPRPRNPDGTLKNPFPGYGASRKLSTIITDKDGNEIGREDGPEEPMATHPISIEEFNRGSDPEPLSAPEASGVTYHKGGPVKSWQRALHEHHTRSHAPATASKPKPSW